MDIFSKNDKADNYAQGAFEKGLFTLMFNFGRLLQFVKLNQKQSKYTGMNYGKLISIQWKHDVFQIHMLNWKLNETPEARKHKFASVDAAQSLDYHLGGDWARFHEELGSPAELL